MYISMYTEITYVYIYMTIKCIEAYLQLAIHSYILSMLCCMFSFPCTTVPFAFVVLKEDPSLNHTAVVKELRGLVAAKIAKYAVPDHFLVRIFMLLVITKLCIYDKYVKLLLLKILVYALNQTAVVKDLRGLGPLR